jgi:N-acylneuraminate cytidylyltransferase
VKTVALIPARGGSQGLPRKNVRLLAGKPLVSHSIEAALRTPAISRVMVSTEDSEIGAVAQAYGAEVIWRPPELSGDSATSESALLHALDHLRDREGYEPDLVVFLQATSPLRGHDDIQKAVELLQAEGADSLFAACPVEGFVWRSTSGAVAPVNYDPTARPRRQELPEAILEENGSIYVFRPWVLRTHHSRLGGKIAVHVMDRLSSFQIDVLSDLALMEHLFRLQQPAALPSPGDIRLLALDFDGVMTDNRVWVDQAGTESVACYRGDGWGIARLKEAGVEVCVISTETNPVVSARCRKLNVAAFQGCADKLAPLQSLARERGLGPEQVAYVGNDVNDLECLQWVGLPIAVADAVPQVRAAARFVTTQLGGRGAVREVADWILSAKGGQEAG